MAGVALWIEGPNRKVTGLIPSQGTCLGFGPRSPVGGVREATCLLHMEVSLPLFLPPFPSL